MMTRELDFSRERQNLDHFAEMFSRRSQDVVIPRPINPLCTKRVLVMEELIGQPLAAFLSDGAITGQGDPGSRSTARHPTARSQNTLSPIPTLQTR